MSDAYFAVTMLIVLGLTIALWVTAWRFPPTRWFWGLLAAGWSLGLSGNIAWGIAFPAGTDLPSFSWLDLFYLARYVLVGAAIGLCVGKKISRPLLVSAALAVLVGIAGYLTVQPIFQAAPVYRWDWLAGLSIYPILDMPVLTLAIWAWFTLQQGALRHALAWLTGGLFAYSVANWINLRTRLIAPQADSVAANLFWLASDLLAIVALGIYWIEGTKQKPRSGS